MVGTSRCWAAGGEVVVDVGFTLGTGVGVGHKVLLSRGPRPLRRRLLIMRIELARPKLVTSPGALAPALLRQRRLKFCDQAHKIMPTQLVELTVMHRSVV